MNIKCIKPGAKMIGFVDNVEAIIEKVAGVDVGYRYTKDKTNRLFTHNIDLVCKHFRLKEHSQADHINIVELSKIVK